MEEPKLEFAYYKDLEVLEHWKNQKHRAQVLTKYRSSTHPENVQALICTCYWLHGYAIDKNQEGNVIDTSTLSKKGSNVLEDADEDIKEKGNKGEEFYMDDISIDEI